MTKKRWICLFVENEIGVLARISGLFSGKSYNIDTLTVGVTQDKSVSRMTIGLTSDDRTFEQIKKTLNRSIEVLKVVDYTEVNIHIKELMFVKISRCSDKDIEEIFRIEQVFPVTIIDYSQESILIQSVQAEEENNRFIALLEKCYSNRIEIVRGGNVAVEALNR